MGQLSAKLRSIEWKGHKGVGFWCPGCDGMHVVGVEGEGAWQWDGNVDLPTFSPSIRTFTNYDENGRLPEGQTRTLCHSFVRAGEIQFLSDCVHALAGQTVPLPDLPAA
jgi:hypothetical protein